MPIQVYIISAAFVVSPLFVWLIAMILIKLSERKEADETQEKERAKIETKTKDCLGYIFQELMSAKILEPTEAKKKTQELSTLLYNLLSGRSVNFQHDK